MYSKLKNFLIETSHDFPYLLKSTYSKKKKLTLLLNYLRFYLVFLIRRDKEKEGSVKIFGFIIEYINFEALLFMFREIFIRNSYYFYSSKKTPIIYDCGANIGVSVIYFKWLYPDCVIHAFEPNIYAFKILKNNIKKNKFKDIHLYNLALLDVKTRVNLYIDLKNKGMLSNSLLRDRLPNDKIKVDTYPLSTLIGTYDIDLLKMDIEGLEEKVMREVIKTNKINQVNEMIIEYHKDIKNNKSTLSDFLKLFEEADFVYRLDVSAIPLYWKDLYQDILIYLRRHE